MADVKKDRRKPPQVMILWWEGPEGAEFEDGNIRTLAYNGGEGDVRVYYKDQYDSRVHPPGQKDPLPYFDNGHDAARYAWKNPGSKCQVNVRASGELGWPKNQLAAVAK